MPTAIVAVALLLLASAGSAQNDSPPHVVLVLADDLGSGDIGAFNPDSKIPTPHLDRIAGKGVRFTDAHSPSAVCTPTRYGLLTGRYAWRTELERGVLWGHSPLLIEEGRPTIASVLAEAGYATAGFGKWHLGLQRRERTDYTEPLVPGPTTVGFGRYEGIPASLDMPPYVWLVDDGVEAPPTAAVADSAHHRQGGDGFWRGGPAAPGFRHRDVLERIGDEAVFWLEERADGERPVFLYLPLSAPHTPWLPFPEFRGRSEAGPYGDFVVQVDALIGRIDRALVRLGLQEDTLLIVTSDNGAHWPPADIERWDHHANHHYRGQKADIHEGGHRVPLIARWPGRTPAGTVCDDLLCLTDLYATVAGLAGAGDPGGGEDSLSFAPRLRGEETAPARTHSVHHSSRGMFAVRQGPWKLIEGRGSGGFTPPRSIDPEDLPAGAPPGQLYHLGEDPGETRNLWNERPGVVEELRGLLTRIREGSAR